MKDPVVIDLATYFNPPEQSSQLRVVTDLGCSEELGTAIQNLIQLLRKPDSTQKKTG